MIKFSPYIISLTMLFHCGQIRSIKKISGLSKLPLENTQENKITIKNPKITPNKTDYIYGFPRKYGTLFLPERKKTKRKREKKKKNSH